MIVDGRTIASAILSEVSASIGGRTTIVRAVVVRPSPATQSYLRIKKSRAEEGGMTLEVVKLRDEATEEEIIEAVKAPGADAVIVQLPIPEHLNWQRVLNEIPLDKDADVLSDEAYARFMDNVPGALVPPVAAGIVEILARSGIEVKGKKTTVVGKGKLVGLPTGTVLERMGAEVSFVVKETGEEEKLALLKEADMVISGAGAAHIIRPEMLKEGVVLVDAGTSGSGGGVAGDMHPDCAQKAALFTPVPGGVGPVAVSCLFKNTAHLLRSRGELA